MVVTIDLMMLFIDKEIPVMDFCMTKNTFQ